MPRATFSGEARPTSKDRSMSSVLVHWLVVKEPSRKLRWGARAVAEAACSTGNRSALAEFRVSTPSWSRP